MFNQARPVWVELLERRVMMDATAALLNLDTSFGSVGYATPLPASGLVLGGPYAHLTAAGGGKFYAVGYGKPTWPHGYETVDLLRINADGSRDSTFAEVHIERPGQWFNFYSGSYQTIDDSLLVGTLLVQPDGKVLLATRDVPYQAPDPILLMRFNSDGTPDQSFGDAGTATLPVDTRGQGNPRVWVQPDGKIDYLDMVAGYHGASPLEFAIQQLNSDGSPDQTFGVGGEQISFAAIDDRFRSAALAGSTTTWWNGNFAGAQPTADGGAVAYVVTQSWNDSAESDVGDVMQVLFDSSGNVISSRSVYRATPFGVSVSIEADGGALILDTSTVTSTSTGRESPTATAGQLTRIAPDGSPDANFGINGIAATLLQGYANAEALSAVEQADGQILITLSHPGWQSDGIERLNADGLPDLTFAGGQPAFGLDAQERNTEALSMPDGSIVLSLRQENYNWWSDSKTPGALLVKLQVDGGTPNTFEWPSMPAPPPPPTPDTPNDSTPGDGSVDPSVDGSGDTLGGDGSDANSTDPNDPNFDPTVWYANSNGDSSDPSALDGWLADNSGDVWGPGAQDAL
jgi:uncharacterized delta-60 repeat protein